MASDAITLIKNDHRVLEKLFELLKKADSERPALLAEVAARLSAHSWAEEERVYPALVKADPAEEGQVYHGVEEHHEATELLHKLQVTDPSSSQFDSLLEEFIEAVNHHVEEEETEILPGLAEAVDQTRLEELGRAFEERRISILEAHGVDDKAVGSGAAAMKFAVGETAGRADVSGMTREELYQKAQDADIPGRSQMTKEELARAVTERG
ncbi:MAG TPA: hemerythrin domain-containing protein [Pilimelia sp.]|nr:hemerythrin domain-containing protein [Pilimelia sp.]